MPAPRGRAAIELRAEQAGVGSHTKLDRVKELVSANRSPLDSLARFALDYNSPRKGQQLLNQYEAFLQTIGDQTKRKELERLDADEALKNEQFQSARKVGRAFDAALSELFFDTAPDLTKLTQRYGVF